jgi:hypothetical protein
MYVGLHKNAQYSYPILMKHELHGQIFKKF